MKREGGGREGRDNQEDNEEGDNGDHMTDDSDEDKFFDIIGDGDDQKDHLCQNCLSLETEGQEAICAESTGDLKN